MKTSLLVKLALQTNMFFPFFETVTLCSHGWLGNSVYRWGWPWTQIPCLCLSSAGIKGVHAALLPVCRGRQSSVRSRSVWCTQWVPWQLKLRKIDPVLKSLKERSSSELVNGLLGEAEWVSSGLCRSLFKCVPLRWLLRVPTDEWAQVNWMILCSFCLLSGEHRNFFQ